MNGAFGGRKSSVCIDGFEITQSSLHSGRLRTNIWLLKLDIQKYIITCTVKSLILQEEFWARPPDMFDCMTIAENSPPLKRNGFWL